MKSVVTALGIVCVCSLFFSAPARAQIVGGGEGIDSVLIPRFPSGFLYHGAGARSLAMGFASVALTDDITSLTWNPAGLLGIEKPTLGLEFRRVGGKGSTDAFGSNFSFSNDISAINFLSFGMQIRLRNQPFGVGLTIDNPVQEVNEFRLYRTALRDNSPYNTDTTRSLYSADTRVESEENILRVSVGFGTRIAGPLTGGASITFYDGKGAHFTENKYRLEHYDDTSSGLNYLTQQVTFEPLLGVRDTVSYSGSSLQLGFRYVRPDFKLGLTFRPKHTMRFTYDYQLINTASVNGQLVNIGGGVIYRDDQVSDFDIPNIITLGGAFNVTPDLTLAADFESRGFGSSSFARRITQEIRTGNNVEIFQTSDPQYQNSISIRLGTEYWLKRATDAAPGFALRAGFRSEDMGQPQFSVDTIQQTFTYTKFRSSSFSVGGGIWWTQIHLDAGVSYTSFTEDQDIAVFDLFNGSVQRGVPPITFVPLVYKANFPTFRLTFTGVF